MQITQNPIKDAKYIWHMDLERIIEAEFGKRLDIQAGEHAQDTALTFHTAEVPEDGELSIKGWLAGETGRWGDTEPSLSVVGHELFVRGLIPEGLYVVHIWW